MGRSSRADKRRSRRVVLKAPRQRERKTPKLRRTDGRKERLDKRRRKGRGGRRGPAKARL